MRRLWRYVEDVESGKQVVGEYIRKAVKRFRSMMERIENDPDCPYYFDEKKAQTFFNFCELCRQYKDKWAGVPLHLEDWQAFLFGNIYGFRKKSNGTRFFKKCVLFIGRKQGKSTLMCPVAIFDGAVGNSSEVYCLATKREQAKIVYDCVYHTIKQDPVLSAMFQNYRSATRLVNKRNSSIIAPLSADYSTQDGLNCSTAIADEIAAWKSYDLLNVIESGMGARTDPFIFEISSGSDNINSVGAQEMEQGMKVLDGMLDAPETLYLLYTIDKTDDWKNPACFIKANPNLGVTTTMENMMLSLQEAMNNPQKEAEFRTKRLCTFISPQSAWIPANVWYKVRENGRTWGKEMPPLEECCAIAGIDLSQRLDFTAYSIYFLHVPTGRYYTKHRFFIPKDQIDDKCKRDSAMVRQWIDQGLIEASGDRVLDYDPLFEHLTVDIEKYNIKEVLYDPWNAGELISRIGELTDLVEVRQSLKEISPLAKDWEAEVTAGNVADDNPVQAYFVSNCDIYTDPNGNIKPVKHGGKRAENVHIDGVITSLMACGRLHQLAAAGEIDTRTAEQIQADAEAFYATFD